MSLLVLQGQLQNSLKSQNYEYQCKVVVEDAWE